MALTSKGHFQVNGTEYKAQSIKVNLESLASEDSGRTDDGVIHINWVLKKIRKVEIQVAPSTTANIAPLLSAVQGQTYILQLQVVNYTAVFYIMAYGKEHSLMRLKQAVKTNEK